MIDLMLLVRSIVFLDWHTELAELSEMLVV